MTKWRNEENRDDFDGGSGGGELGGGGRAGAGPEAG
jgi:hypothetical protein